MKQVRTFIFLIMTLATFQVHAWNTLGHQLIGQIAYDHLTPQAKHKITQYNRAINRIDRKQTLVLASAWMDSLRINNELWLEESHYINLPFSQDGTALLPPKTLNAVVAIQEARSFLTTKSTSDLFARHLTQQSEKAEHFLNLKTPSRQPSVEATIYQLINNSDPDLQKALAIRLLFHVVGDLHQPLHAVSRFDKQHPQGDRGGNLYFIRANSLAKNLHAYWDRGAGFLIHPKKTSKNYIKKRARWIEKRHPCHWQATTFQPEDWAFESRQLAMTRAYRIKSHHKPGQAYQAEARAIVEQRIAMAGCRLAGVLNRL